MTPKEWSDHSVDLADIINVCDPSVNMKLSLLGRYAEDRFFKLIIDIPTSYKTLNIMED